MEQAENNSIKAPQPRSPTYPYISLDAALERASVIYGKIHDQPQPREVLAKAYGKPATSSATIQTFATLSQYGLLENVVQEGARKMRVTKLAREILHPYAPNDKVAAAKKDAALMPAIFRELWERYGDSKKYGDEVVLYYLTHDRESEHGSVFTERAAKEVLRIYRATMDYAGLVTSDKMQTEKPEEEGSPADNPPLDERTDDGEDQKQREPLLPAGSSKRSVEMATGERELQTGILSKGASYRVIVTGKVGVREIERLIAKLELDKEILAASDDEPEPDDHEDENGIFG